MSPQSCHVPRELIKHVWSEWLIGLKCWRWTDRSVLEGNKRREERKNRFFLTASMSHTNKQLSSCLFVKANTDILTLPDSMSYALKLAD